MKNLTSIIVNKEAFIFKIYGELYPEQVREKETHKSERQHKKRGEPPRRLLLNGVSA